MRSRVNWLLGLATELVAMTVIAACGHQVAITPPQIHYGEDVCAFCRMTVDDPRFAAALIYRTAAGGQRVAIFDDIGCMLAWQREHSAHHTIAAFVHDYKTHQWIDAAGAWYVRSAAVQTPMGWGIAAAQTQTDSAAAASGISLKPMDYRELCSAERNTQGNPK